MYSEASSMLTAGILKRKSAIVLSEAHLPLPYNKFPARLVKCAEHDWNPPDGLYKANFMRK